MISDVHLFSKKALANTLQSHPKARSLLYAQKNGDRAFLIKSIEYTDIPDPLLTADRTVRYNYIILHIGAGFHTLGIRL